MTAAACRQFDSYYAAAMNLLGADPETALAREAGGREAPCFDRYYAEALYLLDDDEGAPREADGGFDCYYAVSLGLMEAEGAPEGRACFDGYYAAAMRFIDLEEAGMGETTVKMGTARGAAAAPP